MDRQDKAEDEARFTFDAAAIARALAITTAIVVVASMFALLVSHFVYGQSAHEVRWAQFLYLDGERNIPTAFSVLLLLAAGLLLGVIARLERGRRGVTLYWTVLAVGFCLMAVDEGWSFHEKANAVVRPLFGANAMGVWYYAWVIPALALIALLGVFFLRFLIRLPAPTRWAFLVAGFIYVGGAVGMELVEGAFDELHGDRNLISGLLGTTQETLEMVGVVVFVWALLKYLARYHPNLHIEFRAAQPVAAVEASPPRQAAPAGLATVTELDFTSRAPKGRSTAAR